MLQIDAMTRFHQRLHKIMLHDSMTDSGGGGDGSVSLLTLRINFSPSLSLSPSIHLSATLTAKDFTSGDNRYSSFAPLRKNSYARW